MKFLVEQKYYDSGRINVRVKECNDNEESFSSEEKTYDLYVDVFDNYEEAREFADEALEA